MGLGTRNEKLPKKVHAVSQQMGLLEGEVKGPGSGFGSGVLISSQPVEISRQGAPPTTLGIVQASQKIRKV